MEGGIKQFRERIAAEVAFMFLAKEKTPDKINQCRK